MKKTSNKPDSDEGERYRKALGARIATLAELSGGKRALAQRLGIHESVLYRYIKGENALTAATLVALAEVGGVSVEWLATGTAPAAREPEVAAYQPVPRAAPTTAATAAPGALAFTADWLAGNFNARGDELRLIEAQGEGMEPTLRAGDQVLIDTRVRQVAQDGLYALQVDDGVEIKRLQKLPGARLKVVSDNPGYQTITLSRSAAARQFRILGRVVWYGRRV